LDFQALNSFLIINLNWTLIVGVVILIILLVISALISGSEVAFFSISKTDLENETDEVKNTNLVKELLLNSKKLLATILISNNFVNILFILIFTYVGDTLFESVDSQILKFILEIVLVSFFILLFGEVLPKVYASRNAIKFASRMAGSFLFLNSFLSFLSYPLLKLTSMVEKKLSKKQSDFSVEDLSQALELTSTAATTKEEKKYCKE